MIETPAGQFIHGNLNYPGNSEEKLNKHPDIRNQEFGPNDNGEFMFFVGAEYDAEKDKTKAYFSLNPPEGYNPDA